MCLLTLISQEHLATLARLSYVAVVTADHLSPMELHCDFLAFVVHFDILRQKSKLPSRNHKACYKLVNQCSFIHMKGTLLVRILLDVTQVSHFLSEKSICTSTVSNQIYVNLDCAQTCSYRYRSPFMPILATHKILCGCACARRCDLR